MLRSRLSSASPPTIVLHEISWPLRAPLGVTFTPSGEIATVYSFPSSSSSRLIVLSSFVAMGPQQFGEAPLHKCLCTSVSQFDPAKYTQFVALPSSCVGQEPS